MRFSQFVKYRSSLSATRLLKVTRTHGDNSVHSIILGPCNYRIKKMTKEVNVMRHKCDELMYLRFLFLFYFEIIKYLSTTHYLELSEQKMIYCCTLINIYVYNFYVCIFKVSVNDIELMKVFRDFCISIYMKQCRTKCVVKL